MPKMIMDTVVPVHLDEGEFGYPVKTERAILFMGKQHLVALRAALEIAYEDASSCPREIRDEVSELWTVLIEGKKLEAEKIQ